MTASTANVAPDWGLKLGITELWTEVVPGLFVGGTADNDVLGGAVLWDGPASYKAPEARAVITKRQFDAVVTMYAYARPVDWHVEELRWGIMDDPEGGIDQGRLRETVEWAHRRWARGERVLIRCQAGLNRSSLIAALVLRESGMDADEAISTIRRTRSYRALFNDGFVAQIHAGLEA